MRRLIPLVVFAFSAAAQTPSLSGVWMANLQRSHIAGPPVSQYLVLFQPATGRKGQKLVKSITGMRTKYGLEKSVLTFRDDGKPMMTPYQGIPTRVTASWQGSELAMTARVAGTPRLIESTYKLSAGGHTLTIDSTVTGGRRPEHNTIVLTKQAQSAAAPL
ncbi:MAG: hypothetical protein ACRD45_19855, partial [Bryobacteraceae bacterium]